ncbi:hypothetical protein [Microcoleus sp. bin38.metabat.b11b12b14.051]|uniref:hypothetical protein n=1 Tax=Microcoleus sp. bin38.metabat.b11b12b14.051 TaxID=2742709 RepID=UPI0025D26BDF|nr:hypothetical protein [Microcoleus sp. bin38.metabat.b11b12b14.051]
MNKNRLTANVITGLVTLALTIVLSSYRPVVAQNTAENSPAPKTTTALQESAAKPAEIAKPSLKSPPSTDKPTEVSLGFSVLNLGRINQADETFDISGFLYAAWQDKQPLTRIRLAIE